MRAVVLVPGVVSYARTLWYVVQSQVILWSFHQLHLHHILRCVLCPCFRYPFASVLVPHVQVLIPVLPHDDTCVVCVQWVLHPILLFHLYCFLPLFCCLFARAIEMWRRFPETPTRISNSGIAAAGSPDLNIPSFPFSSYCTINIRLSSWTCSAFGPDRWR